MLQTYQTKLRNIQLNDKLSSDRYLMEYILAVENFKNTLLLLPIDLSRRKTDGMSMLLSIEKHPGLEPLM
jgi:hypothetical protein